MSCNSTALIAATTQSKGDLHAIKVSECTRTILGSARTDMLGFESCSDFVRAASSSVPGIGKCTPSEVDTMCKSWKDSFTPEQATQYCTHMVRANDEYWTNTTSR